MTLRTLGLWFSCAVGLCGSSSLTARADDTPAPPPLTDQAERSRVKEELASGDNDRVNAAVQEVKNSALGTNDPRKRQRPQDLQLLIGAEKNDEAQAIAMEGIMANLSTNAYYVGQFQAVRAKALLADKKPQEALAAAKAYYNVCAMRSNDDAIKLVAQCLAAARPDDQDIVERFQREQAGSGPTTQPSGDTEAPPSVLSAIQVDPGPFEQAIENVQGGSYDQLVAKGNLLLLVDKPKDALQVFLQSIDSADERHFGEAIDNVARAIRAQSGNVGPANAYLQSIKDKAKQVG